MKKIGIIGCGWLGSKLCAHFSRDYQIYATTGHNETAQKLAEKGYHASTIFLSSESLNIEKSWEVVSSLDVLMVLIPFSLQKMSTYALEVKVRNLLLLIGDYRGQIFFSSSTGVYPKEKKIFFEKDLASSDNPVEQLIKDRYPTVNILRLGGLMGDNRLLRKYKVSNVEAPVNHVHYQDVCKVIIQMIELGILGKLYNVVAPLHPSKKQVIESQKTNKLTAIDEPNGRIISSRKLIEELPYDFEFPDPRTFHSDL